MSKKKDKKNKTDLASRTKKGKKTDFPEKSIRAGKDKGGKDKKEKKHPAAAKSVPSGKQRAGKKQAGPKRAAREAADGLKDSGAPACRDVSALFSQIEKDALLSREIEALPLNLAGSVLYASEIRSLRTVRDAEPVNLTGLARRLEITKTGASKNIAKLLEKGLVKKESRQNRREVLFTLTPKGRLCAGSIDDSLLALYQPVRELLATFDTALLTDFFRRLEVVLTAILDEKQL